MMKAKDLIDNALMKEIISIRADSLWKMLWQKKAGNLPEKLEEGATGKFDNKGAIFLPGGMIYHDVDENPIQYDRRHWKTAEEFRQKIREAMKYDNATLIFPDGIAQGINLDSGFFSKAARRIITFRKAAFRRKSKIGSHKHLKVNSSEIIRSHCPTYQPAPYGSRTRISTCAALGLIDAPLYFSYCDNQFNFSMDRAKSFSQSLDAALDPVTADDGAALFVPAVVVCHDTRYKDNNMTGLTRILGIGKFGEFATFTMELMNKQLSEELRRKKQTVSPEDSFAEFNGERVLGILRVYSATNPGRRSLRYRFHILSPEKDAELDVEQIKQKAEKRYAPSGKATNRFQTR